MANILNQCPICGSRLEFAALHQYSNIYNITKDGKLSARRIRKTDDGPMECGYISCSNEECNFNTDCDLEIQIKTNIRIFQRGSVFMYETVE